VRAAFSAAACLMVALAGCGYVGPVLPPSPLIPNAVTGLGAVERGDRLRVTFSTPPRTTDQVAIKTFSEIDLRIGPAASPFDFASWAATAKQYPVNLPPPNDPDDPQPASISTELPVSEWQGKRVVIAVRTAVKHDRYSSWSNRVVLNIVAPLEPPLAKAEATAQGVALNWPAQRVGLTYRIYRQSPADKQPVEIGTANQPRFVDTSAQSDIEYRYTIVAFKDLAESLPSAVVSITPIDKFAPSVPAGVTALAGPDSIEVSWHRSPESDMQGYYVYRSVNGAPFERQGALVGLPAFSDRKVEHGKTYRYEISAVDKKNNESDKSAPAEAAF
jgi:fibronectin type 3 domain-containing protein